MTFFFLLIQTTLSSVSLKLVVLAVLSYLAGNINFALIISKLKKTDVRKMGSGNPGTLNMSRNFGLKIGLLTLFLDMLKGGVPSFLGYLIMREYFIGVFSVGDLTRFICGLCVIIGHIYPVTLKFRGGKGIASTLGIFVFSQPVYSAIILLFALVYIYITEMGSMGSLIAVSGLAGMQLLIFLNKYQTFTHGGNTVFLYALILSICFLTWYAHRKNIVKLLAGEEHRTSIRQLSKKKAKQ